MATVFARRAFTLAEVMLGLSLLAMMALGLLGLFVSSSTSSEGGTARVEAINLASQELNRWKNLPYAQLVGLLATPPSPYDQQFRGRPYHIQLALRRSDANPNKLEYSMLELKITVAWEQKDRLEQDGQKKSGSGQARREESLYTLISPGSYQ